MSDIAAVVINYNAGDHIIACMHALVAEDPAEIVLVDNGSSDGSTERVEAAFPQVRVIRNRRNSGFAAAANQGVGETTTPYVLLINPDAVVEAGALKTFVATFRARPRVAAIGPLVHNPDGSIQPTRRAFPSIGQAALHGIVGIFRPNNAGTRAYTMAEADPRRASTADWVAGTALAVRRDAFDAVGGFDESFFFFVEDVDLCRRLWDAGYEVWFEPDAVVVHEWGASWTQRPVRYLWMHQRNVFRYVTKHMRGGWRLAYPLIAAGLLVRFGVLALRWLITRRSVPSHRSADRSAGGSV